MTASKAGPYWCTSCILGLGDTCVLLGNAGY